MKDLGSTGLGIDTYLNWASKKMKVMNIHINKYYLLNLLIE